MTILLGFTGYCLIAYWVYHFFHTAKSIYETTNNGADIKYLKGIKRWYALYWKSNGVLYDMLYDIDENIVLNAVFWFVPLLRLILWKPFIFVMDLIFKVNKREIKENTQRLIEKEKMIQNEIQRLKADNMEGALKTKIHNDNEYRKIAIENLKEKLKSYE